LAKLKRVIKTGFINFWRNSFVSLASILVMTVTLVVIGLIIYAGALFSASLTQLKDKVDINVYFVTSAPESDIIAITERSRGTRRGRECRISLARGSPHAF
jgi:cell division protein FtsX